MSRFPARLSVVFFGLTVLVAPLAVMAENVPDALSVEWQGQKPCEKLFEDAQIHIARCTFPSGAMHVCHSHPSYISYVLSGGKAQIQDEKGTRQVELSTGSHVNVPPVPWHELTNWRHNAAIPDRREEVSGGTSCQSDRVSKQSSVTHGLH
jgi:quercetin dioxygenase-like cupin family protein